MHFRKGGNVSMLSLAAFELTLGLSSFSIINISSLFIEEVDLLNHTM